MEKGSKACVAIVAWVLFGEWGGGVRVGAEWRAPPAVTVGGQIEVNSFGGGADWFEPSAAASQLNENELAIVTYGGRWAITINGGGLFTVGSFQSTVPPVGFTVSDPLAACGPGSGRIFGGGVQAGNPNEIWYLYRDPGETSFHLHGAFNFGFGNDRPSMGIGPSTWDPNVTSYYMAYNYRPQGVGPCLSHPLGGGTGPIFAASSTSPVAPFPFWAVNRLKPAADPPSACNYDGWGATPVVCADGTVVVASRDVVAAGTQVGLYNDRCPWVMFSADGGVTWEPTGPEPVLLNTIPPIQGGQLYPTNSFDLGDTPWGVDKRNNSPGVAVDRSVTPNVVYVAFYARATPGLDTDDNNSDLYIFRGTNNGRVWGSQTGLDYIHITDADLGIPASLILPTGPDQVAPSMAVDCTGALCLMLYDSRNDLVGPSSPPGETEHYRNNKVDVYFMRLAWGASSFSIVTQARLTPKVFPTAGASGPEVLGDFFAMPVAGETQRRLYPVYVARKELSPGVWSGRNLYTHKITVNICPSGLAGALFQEEQVGVMVDAILSQEPEGDLNGDDSTDFPDLELLGEWVAGGGDSR